MSLLVPLGLLGLLGIAALILIYILKPNYQQKIISSTYVWKLSLRYRKKKIPVSRLRNIILLICQILTIAACAFIMTKPIAEAAQPLPGGEKIAVIDASAGMLTEGKTDTRFERAVRQVKSLARETFAKSERISVILAGTSASYLVQRSDATKAEDVYERLDSLVSGSLQCSYGSADMDGAMKLAEGVLELNPDAEILLYTGTEYIAPGEVTVVDVAEEGEWNAAILDVEAELRENYYAFTVSVACYGADEELTVNFAFSGVNYDKTALSWSTVVPCSGGETQVFVLDTSTYGGEGIYSFDSLRVYIQTRDDDSFGYDNNFYFYGTRETIRIQYASARPNDFFGFALMSLRSNSFLQREWNIELVEVQNKTPETEGFDFYIFESMLPDPVPNDGVVFLVDPPEAPPGLGVTFAGTEEGEVFFTAGESNRILDAVDPTAGSVYRIGGPARRFRFAVSQSRFVRRISALDVCRRRSRSAPQGRTHGKGRFNAVQPELFQSVHVEGFSDSVRQYLSLFLSVFASRRAAKGRYDARGYDGIRSGGIGVDQFRRGRAFDKRSGRKRRFIRKFPRKNYADGPGGLYAVS